MYIAADAWWADWPKFAPGWLAFLVTSGTLIRKGWHRRHKLALGPADNEVRDALKSVRSLFEDITGGGKSVDWFTDDERRETDRALRDLAERRTDKPLKAAMNKVADSWNEAFSYAPPPRVLFTVGVETAGERQERLDRLERTAKQVEFAHLGLLHVKAALARLNELEQKTTGR
ncbi:hypothetical protein OIE69_08655 [Actinacidiphila glaucinigra]|uniref:hypothetical protein n=1 Tax=Actinacidiphila glaucinigra TaxID=235986 RepID=UPI002DDBBC67|nr:hypothetical protein [Actinacidiphila glaucinigra]WSD58976.1 hypothetical protein OIE69_08655 [Actinacidiphila glaucinigra]